MSDMLNEKFEEFASEQKDVLKEYQDPMPTVTATVIPGTGSDPSQVSGDPQQRGTAKEEPSGSTPTVPPSVANGQSVNDLGGSSTPPLHAKKEKGEENPGAKASAPISQDGSAASPSGKGGDDAGYHAYSGDITHGTSKGPDVQYPIKPSFEEVELSDDVKALLEGTELSDEFAEKAKTIFEAAIKAKLAEEYDKLVEHFAKQTEEKLAASKAELNEEVNGTVNYAVNQWIEENQIAIDRGIKNEITEDFIVGLKNLFEEHYISIPDDKVDAVESMAESIREMEERLDEQVKANVKLQNRLNESAKTVILKQVSEGLAETQKDKLSALAEGVEFKSEEEYSKKLSTIKESYFPKEKTHVSEVSDETPVQAEDMSPAMGAYMDALNRWN
tara:strand:- start:3608 stop:4771 length:1164 start_codon:yes stop_codon:yes gene_type:complete